MVNHPDNQTQGEMPPLPSGKLILPALDEEPPIYITQKTAIRPEHLIRQQGRPAPRGLFAKTGYYWRKDPAYKVLMLAVGMVVIAAIIFVSLASAAFRGVNLSPWNTSYTQSPPTAGPTGTVDLRPKFPTPGGGQGSSQSSQPAMQKTPALQPTPGGAGNPPDPGNPTPGPGGTLTVQITNPPNVVANNSRFGIDVSTSEAGATVRLQVTYNASPFFYASGARTTDGNGNAILGWSVRVFAFRAQVQANLVVIAIDQNGQQAISQPITVLVLSGGNQG
jgi:hypothetical protein